MVKVEVVVAVVVVVVVVAGDGGGDEQCICFLDCLFAKIAEALHYLHTNERMLHLNVSPQSIVITKKGAWKLTGLGFLQGIEADIKVSSSS